MSSHLSDHTTTIGFHDPLDDGGAYPDSNWYAARQAVALERIAIALERLAAIHAVTTGYGWREDADPPAVDGDVKNLVTDEQPEPEGEVDSDPLPF